MAEEMEEGAIDDTEALLSGVTPPPPSSSASQSMYLTKSQHRNNAHMTPRSQFLITPCGITSLFINFALLGYIMGLLATRYPLVGRIEDVFGSCGPRVRL